MVGLPLFVLAHYLLNLPGFGQNAPDYIDSLGGKVDYWHPEKMPLKIFIVEDKRVPNYKSQFKDYVLQACKSWSSACQGKISFKFVQAEPCDIRISWTNDLNQLLQRGELGEARWENDRDGLFRATIKLLTVSEDGRRPISDQEAKLMSLHELGHALGLVKHSPYLGDIMNACIDFNFNTPVENLDLSARDKRTIFRLYTESEEIIDKLSAESSDPHVKLMRLCFRADKLLQEEKYETAFVLLERALKIDPNCQQAQNAMASCCFDQGMDFYSAGNYEIALDRLERFLTLCHSLHFEDSPQYSQAKQSISRCKSKISEKRNAGPGK